MAIPNINDTYPVAPLENLFNIIGDAAEADIAALTPRSPNVVFKVTDLNGLAAITTEINGDLAYSAEGQFLLTSNGTVWTQATPAIFASTAARDTAFAKAAGVYRVAGARASVGSTNYVWSGTAWVAGAVTMNQQLDTTNSVAGMMIQVGTGRIPGAVALDISETLTFPVPFAAGTVPHVNAAFAGAINPGGTFNPGATVASNTQSAYTHAPSATGCTVHINRPANMTAGVDYYYTWIAIGVAA